MIMACEEKDTTENAQFLLLVEKGSVDDCKRYLHKFPDALEKRNKRRETALHVAARKFEFVNLLLNKGADVNVKNFWGQTPLHYTAQAKSVKSIRRLLQVEKIDATCKDANGYTALHYIFSTIDDDGISWKSCLECLVDAGLDINSTTNTGKSIFHQIAYLYDPSKAYFHFEDIFSKCPNADLFSKDLEGRNFLHTWNQFQKIDVRIFNLIQRLKNKDTVTQLLNQNDFSGITPFMQIATGAFTSTGIIAHLVKSYGALLTSSNNLKNTTLHVLSTNGDTLSCQIIELLMELGIDVNARNIFGQTALSLLNIDDSFNVFSKNSNTFNVKWDCCDRWNRTPFFDIVYNAGTYVPFVLQMLQQNDAYINGEDIFKSTPLHFAAYIGDCHKVQLLLYFTTADRKTVLDEMGDSPAETAVRHGHFECYKVFNENYIYKPPVYVHATSLKGVHDIREILTDYPKNMEEYFDDLLLNKHISNSQIPENSEDMEIVAAVNKLVGCICDSVKRYDPRFEMSVFQTGSTAEGTKVGPPDEFDFALSITALSLYCNVTTPSNAHNQFVCLRFEENAVADYLSFSDENRYFVALPFLHYLFRYVKRALKEEQLWINGNLSFRPDESIRVFLRKPVFNFNVYWNGSKYKKLKISIDLLPVVHKSEWWPTFITRRKPLDDHVVKAGCFVILHSKLHEFDKQWLDMNDNINSTCKRQNGCKGEQSENQDHLLLRVSVAPAEIALMKSLPEKLRKAYSLAKIVLMKDVSPMVNIDYTPPNLGKSFKEHFTHQFVHNFKHIKSYWLKNCTFYVAEETDCDEKSSLDITKLIYEKLLEYVTSCQLKAYLFQQSDILAPEKGERESVNNVRELLLMRKVCLDMVLGFLGKPFPEDNSEWILKCEQHYKPFKEESEVQSVCSFTEC